MNENKDKSIIYLEEEKPIIEFPALIRLIIIFMALCLGLGLLILPWHFVLFIFLGLCVGLAVFFNTYIGLLLFLIVATLHPGKFISETYGLYYLSRYLAFGILFIWLFHTIVYRDFKIVKAKQNLAVLGFALMIFISCIKDRGFISLFGIDYTTHSLLDYMKLFILYFLVINLIKNRKQFFIFIWGLIFLGTISCFIGLYQYINKIGLLEEGGILRITGTAADPNYFALHLVMLIPLSVSLFLSSKSILARSYLAGFFMLSLLNIFFTFSRGGMIGLVIVLSLSFFMLVLHNRKKLIPVFISVLFILSIIPLIPEQYWSRIRTIPDVKDVAIRARLDTWRAGYEIILEHPLMGVGVGNFRYEYFLKALASPDIRMKAQLVAHNTFIEIAAESGILALIFFLTLIFWTLRDLRQKVFIFQKEKDDPFYWVSRALIISLIGYIGCGVFVSQQYLVMFWIIAPLAVVLRQLYLNKAKNIY